MSPAHLVYATVALTAGSTPISIPSIAEANPELVVWLSVDDSGRTSHAIRNSVAEDGSSISLVPSHDDGLVREVGGPILPIPGTQCAALLPGNRCEVTLTWWFYGHGKIDRIRGLTLAALNAATAELQNNAPYEPWPTTKAETECRGVMAEWCSS